MEIQQSFLHIYFFTVKNRNMMNILFRLLIIYFVTVLSMRLMGKRQIGEMQMSELVTAFFLSELATYAISDSRIPLFYALIPILCLISIEVIISYMTLKIPLFKKLFDSRPNVLIDKGKILEKELSRNRVTLDELLSMLRLKDYADLSEVYYAILEPNGQLSVIPKSSAEPLKKGDAGKSENEKGYSLAVIDDGKINRNALDRLQKDEKWLRRELKKRKIESAESVFLFSYDEAGKAIFVKKEEK